MTRAPVCVHSHYSFCEGLASPRELVDTAARHQLPALALTDRWLTGAVEFDLACRAAGVRALHGLDLAFSDPMPRTSLTLLAMDMAGWANLCALSSLQRSNAAHADSLPLEALAARAGGLIVLAATDDQASLGQLRDVAGDRLYAALASDQAETRAAVAGRLSIPLAAAPSIFYLTPDQADQHTTATAIRLNRPRADLAPSEVAPDAHFPSPDEMAARFAGRPEALAAMNDIADRCRLTLPLGEPHYPEIDLPPGETALAVLRRKARAGAERRYGAITPDVDARLEHELGVIGARGYAPLFLIMQEVLDYARQAGVPIASRGSAASSLVAHCLELTSPDPLRLNLYFERFLNPARSTPPDIDTDLCSRRRDRVIEHVFDRYGHDRVAMVSTINRFRERSALRETAKAFGLRPAEATRLVNQLPERWWGPPQLRRDGQAPLATLAERYPQHRPMFEHAAYFLDRPHHLSVHPGGVVISPGPMAARVPTYHAGRDLPVTQFDLESVEQLGLIKIDLLGIRGLTVIADVAETVGGRRGLARPLALLDSVPEADGATRDLVRAAGTIGCFGIESPGMRATLKEIDAQSIDDLMIALALYRPGPMTGGLKDAFVRRHLGREPVEQLHPALEPLLADTHGVILYQEQVLRIAHELAGLSLADADLLRRAMSHFDPGRQMQSLRQRFVAGAEARRGVPPEVGARVWELMAAFAGYGFPKAHAASYAQVAWRSAWCKAHHPAEFMAAVLANWGGYYPQRVYLTEARRMGLTLRPPHVNHAQREFSVQIEAGRPVLTMGLDQVRDLTRRTINRLIALRPFTSLADLLTRADPRPQEAEHLIRVGALEGLGPIPALLRALKGGRWQRGQLALFETPGGAGDDWPLERKVAAQEELLNASVIAHPLELVTEAIAAAGALTTVLVAGRVGQVVRVVGMRQTWRRTATARGGYIYFMALEDLEGMLDVVIHEPIYRRSRAALKDSHGPFIVEGRVELDAVSGEPAIRAERIERL